MFILHDPQVVALVAEILQAQPDGSWVCNQRRAPIIENLQPSDAHIGLLYVDPVVGQSPAVLHAFQQQTCRHEASVGEIGRNLRDLCVVRIQHRDQIFDRHRGDEIVAMYTPHRVRNLIVHIDADDFVGFTLHGDHALPQVNRSPKCGYAPGNFLPHLARPKFGIQESLYQAGFRPLLSGIR